MRSIAPLIAVCIAGWSAPALAQTTRPAAGAELTVTAWTCDTHEQFRMRSKGECPICEEKLVRMQVTIQGSAVHGDVYPLDTCPVSGLELGSKGSPIIMMHEGREVRLCCAGCIKRFDEDAGKYLKKIDEKIVAQQLAGYPLETCPVSHEPLDAMGTPVDYVYNNRLVRFCCKGCIRGFKKDPAPALAVLNAAVIEQQSKDYPLTTCPVSKQPLGSMGEPVDYVVANRLVRFCCGGCAAAVYKAPSVYLAQLAVARKQEGHEDKHEHGQEQGHDRGHDHDHDHDH